MDRVIFVLGRLFNTFFNTSSGTSVLGHIIYRILRNPYTYISAVLLIIGFSISIIKRIIHS